MKHMTFLVISFIVSACSSPDNGDEYDYIDTPTAEQWADHIDDDSDGVINERDFCPSTFLGSEIDNDGCSLYTYSSKEKKFRIYFANDSDVIHSTFIRQVLELSNFLKDNLNTSIEIQGYASRIGTADYNLDLSQRRAENVRKELMKNGISGNRVTIVSYGDTVLATQGSDQISHALNRRVIAVVVDNKVEVEKEWTIFTTLPKN
ncbi:OmpA family protein [Vibrio lentus]|uniref:OmpA family protein n=1 Tax=Vibrio lentus TaxID=136468 RepID=UPI000C84549C|nr:OmpA family protein [Vibrio lentus]PMM33384.1 hypothetical protein BCT58_26745 [Vibrio lentus]